MALNKIYTITQGKTDKDDYHKCKMFKDKERHYWWGWRFKSRWKEKWQTYDKIYQNIWNLQCYKKMKTYKTRPQMRPRQTTWSMRYEVVRLTYCTQWIILMQQRKICCGMNKALSLTDAIKLLLTGITIFSFLTSPSLCS